MKRYSLHELRCSKKKSSMYLTHTFMPKIDTRKTTQQASLQALQELLSTAERSLHHAKNLMVTITGKKTVDSVDKPDITGLHTYKDGKAKVIEGVFDGKDML